MAIGSLHQFSNREELAEQLASNVLTQLSNAIAENGRGRLAVSGGSTPALLFETLAKKAFDWHLVDLYLIDERNVPPTHERSNEKSVREMLLQDQAAAANFVPLRAQTAKSTDWPEQLDVAILGLGTDGHTASWFPGADNLEVATSSDCGEPVLFMNAPDVPEERLTFTYPTISRSNFIALHIEGDKKMQTLNTAKENGPANDMPIRHLLRATSVSMQVYWAP